ncbi:cob(I)yrinic acid a,c-diamide adenosyltransferase [Ignatzschineria sp. RMDPL8A]|uniref:cob(I)yrinic acid a,c-diamide adenosyltransferase n=1 Tax=Ignatzschineria sp. RMDPL8A TaxID=2999236 RepID=UPI0024467524|nr:cob(I)yrinic acid a,c-diamide adenosyltransferase [Ignatzschineria sp. RMDPL8A]MDG9729085.1 cob(I)yrinic acid a,c-diamide adenosyltransferase [Ignatzschineria sp. RMDPL8A]
MGNRLSKIVTKTGDQGTTGIAGNIRLSKADLRIEAIGDIDELNAHFGEAIALLKSLTQRDNSDKDEMNTIESTWLTIQHHLFNLGGELAMPEHAFIDASITETLERLIVAYNEALPPLKEFILPGGSILVAKTHLLRTITRRVERRLVALHERDPLNPASIIFINRLSDYLFVTARHIARITKTPEVMWDKTKL